MCVCVCMCVLSLCISMCMYVCMYVCGRNTAKPPSLRSSVILRRYVMDGEEINFPYQQSIMFQTVSTIHLRKVDTFNLKMPLLTPICFLLFLFSLSNRARTRKRNNACMDFLVPYVTVVLFVYRCGDTFTALCRLDLDIDK